MIYYFLPYENTKKLEYYDYYYNDTIRAAMRIENDDYPSHRHRSSGIIQIMELIPEKRFLSTNYLTKNIYLFKSADINKADIIKYDNRYYLLSFEKENNTNVYQHHINNSTK